MSEEKKEKERRKLKTQEPRNATKRHSDMRSVKKKRKVKRKTEKQLWCKESEGQKETD